MSNLTAGEYLSELSTAIGLFSAAAVSADTASPVTACPGWTSADLIAHLGYIHCWSEIAVRTGGVPGDAPEFDGPDEELPAWYRRAGGLLAGTLASTPPDRACWTLGEPRTAGFWRRRQLHETLIHLFDLAGAQNEPWAVRADIAGDGIDEVLTMFYPRQLRRQRAMPLPGVLRFSATDTGEVYSTGPADGATPLGTVEASAAHLYLLLSHRLPPEHAEIRIEPSRAAVDAG